MFIVGPLFETLIGVALSAQLRFVVYYHYA